MPPAWVVRSAGEMQRLGRDMASRDAGGGLRNVIPNPLREIPNERSPTEEKPPLDRNPVPLTTPTDTEVGMNQYGRLTGFLLNQPSTEVTVTFAEMEDQEKIGISLPSAAKRSVRWWENESARDALDGCGLGSGQDGSQRPADHPFGDGHPPRGRRVV
jgi:hypothetical protein